MSNRTMMWNINNNSSMKVLDQVKECKPGNVIKSPAANFFGIQWVLHLYSNGSNINNLGQLQCFAIPSLPPKLMLQIKQISFKTRLLIRELPHLAPTTSSSMTFGASVNTYCNEFISNYQFLHIINLNTLTIIAEFELIDITCSYGSIRQLWLKNPATAIDTKKNQLISTNQLTNHSTNNNQNPSIKKNEIQNTNSSTKSHNTTPRNFSDDDNEDGQISSRVYSGTSSHSRSRSRSRNKRKRHRHRHHSSHYKYDSYDRRNNRKRSYRNDRKHRKRKFHNGKQKFNDGNISSDVSSVCDELQKVISDSMNMENKGDTSPTYPYQFKDSHQSHVSTSIGYQNPVSKIKQMLFENNKSDVSIQKECIETDMNIKDDSNELNTESLSMNTENVLTNEFETYKNEMYEWGKQLKHDINNRFENYEKKIENIEKRLNDMETKHVIKMDECKRKLRNWFINDVKLPQYIDVFISNGFENLDFLSMIGNSELNDMNIVKIGHKMQILNEIKKLNQYELDLQSKSGSIVSHDSSVQ